MLRISWAASRAEILRLDESEWEAVVAESQPTVGLPKGVLLKQLSNLTGFQIRICMAPTRCWMASWLHSQPTLPSLLPYDVDWDRVSGRLRAR